MKFTDKFSGRFTLEMLRSEPHELSLELLELGLERCEAEPLEDAAEVLALLYSEKLRRDMQ